MAEDTFWHRVRDSCLLLSRPLLNAAVTPGHVRVGLANACVVWSNRCYAPQREVEKGVHLIQSFNGDTRLFRDTNVR
jgi:hypothetical protein